MTIRTDTDRAHDDAPHSATWAELVPKLIRRDPDAMDQLYRVFRSDVRYYISRDVRFEEVDDLVHDTYLAVVQAIQQGQLRDPERLMGFVRTVARRAVFAQIEITIQERRKSGNERFQESLVDHHHQSPESRTLRLEETDFIREVLASLDERDREILNRCYMEHQTAEQVCEEMGLTTTQFRLLKNRAKGRFGDTGRSLAATRNIQQ